MNTTTKPKHIGRNISRIRELKGMKQEALAFAIGVSHHTMATMEQNETIEDEMLSDIAIALGVTVEALKNFTDEYVINIFNNFYDNSFSNSQGTFCANQCTFNTLDKIIEIYERLVEVEKEKIAFLEKLLNK